MEKVIMKNKNAGFFAILTAAGFSLVVAAGFAFAVKNADAAQPASTSPVVVPGYSYYPYQPGLVISTSPNTPPSQNIAPGSLNVPLLAADLSGSGNRDVSLASINFTCPTGSAENCKYLLNGRLYDGSTLLAKASPSNPLFFKFNRRLFIPRGSVRTLVYRADISPSASLGSQLQLQLHSSGVGVWYPVKTPVTGQALGGLMTIVGNGSSNGVPEIIAVSPIPSQVQPNETVNFSWSATDPDNDDLFWSVDWGDGVPGTSACMVNPPAGTGENWDFSASHAWTKSGSYKVTATVTDCRGGTDSYSFTILVGSPTTPSNPPVIDGVSGPTVLQPGQTGTWTIRAHDPNNGTLTYSVDFGDAVSYPEPQTKSAAPQFFSQTSTFTHSYANGGVYTVVLKVTNQSGLSAQSSISVNVEYPQVWPAPAVSAGRAIPLSLMPQKKI